MSRIGENGGLVSIPVKLTEELYVGGDSVTGSDADSVRSSVGKLCEALKSLSLDQEANCVKHIMSIGQSELEGLYDLLGGLMAKVVAYESICIMDEMLASKQAKEKLDDE